jgi:uncharacterized protein-like protein
VKEIGEYLKETRIEAGVSLDEAAEDLNLSENVLENIESGNVRAFKDIYALKDDVIAYAKYLGIDSEKIEDEFNEFLFEKTSKISVADIMNAQRVKDEEENKRQVISPYTMEYKEKKNLKPIYFSILLIFIAIIVIYLISLYLNKTPDREDELRGVIYEEQFTK